MIALSPWPVQFMDEWLLGDVPSFSNLFYSFVSMLWTLPCCMILPYMLVIQLKKQNKMNSVDAYITKVLFPCPISFLPSRSNHHHKLSIYPSPVRQPTCVVCLELKRIPGHRTLSAKTESPKQTGTVGDPIRHILYLYYIYQSVSYELFYF